jgi:hypothetical protein
MNTATEHAEDEAPGWQDRARALLARFVAENPGAHFIAPEIRSWAQARGLDSPASVYAWGNVLRMAHKEGAISPVGYSQHGDGTTNTQPVRVWKAQGADPVQLSLADRVRSGDVALEDALRQRYRDGLREGRKQVKDWSGL